MDFYEITKTYAKDKFGAEISIDEIKESIAYKEVERYEGFGRLYENMEID